MKFLALALLLFASCNGTKKFKQNKNEATTALAKLHDGDIIFNSSTSGQSLAVQIATKSKLSHCGLLFYNTAQQEWHVIEAVEPVKWTPLSEWQHYGDNDYYVVKRYKKFGEFTDTLAYKLKSAAEKQLGKHYDGYFGWDDDLIYCSELVWKSYKSAYNISLGTLEKFGSMQLQHPEVQKILKERYGNKLPLEEQVISPASIFADTNLVTIMEHSSLPK